ncbi:cold shock domain-containing protein [Microbulbifer sp. Q7]|uniref:cold shock domain-containing protein n=1 Tax=Microbulbifer sp. Q7 TaxID=1785091 RepID=UPI0009EEF2E2|nr:cold shock domain-containing protein [Microbulbifer sp. Q7]
MKGKITQWDDDRGFGFISVANSEGRIFFHISSIKTRSRRPEIGDDVEFSLSKDKNGKPRATGIAISGLPLSATGQRKSSNLQPPRKNAFDYLLMVVAICSISYSGYSFYLSHNIAKFWPYLIPAAISLFLLGRNKRPPHKTFTCAKCKTVEEFGPRTIAAWNRGMTRLFCGACHRSWINEQPKESARHTRNGSGCLGMLVVLALPPTIFGIAIYQYLA